MLRWPAFSQCTHPKLRQSLHAEIERLLDTTPSSIACHSAQGEFWSTTIESALIKLSLLQAQTERQLYNHTIRGQGAFSDVPFATVSQALEAAHKSLRGQEHDMVTEARALDEQLQAYTALLELVDGGKKGAYKQIVDDWTKIKQDTDECLRDLRRLGWTGEWSTVPQSAPIMQQIYELRKYFMVALQHLSRDVLRILWRFWCLCGVIVHCRSGIEWLVE